MLQPVPAAGALASKQNSSIACSDTHCPISSTRQAVPSDESALNVACRSPPPPPLPYACAAGTPLVEGNLNHARLLPRSPPATSEPRARHLQLDMVRLLLEHGAIAAHAPGRQIWDEEEEECPGAPADTPLCAQLRHPLCCYHVSAYWTAARMPRQRQAARSRRPVARPRSLLAPATLRARGAALSWSACCSPTAGQQSPSTSLRGGALRRCAWPAATVAGWARQGPRTVTPPLPLPAPAFTRAHARRPCLCLPLPSHGPTHAAPAPASSCPCLHT